MRLSDNLDKNNKILGKKISKQNSTIKKYYNGETCDDVLHYGEKLKDREKWWKPNGCELHYYSNDRYFKYPILKRALHGLSFKQDPSKAI